MNPIIARLIRVFEAFNALNVRTAEIFIQKSAGPPNVDRGVADLEYEVLSNGVVSQTGRSGNNGRIVVRVLPGANTVLRVMGSEYQIFISTDPFDAVNTNTGRKERLRYLGYQIGRDGAQGNGVDNAAQSFEYERSILDFQGDHSLTTDADPATVEADLQNDAGA